MSKKRRPAQGFKVKPSPDQAESVAGEDTDPTPAALAKAVGDASGATSPVGADSDHGAEVAFSPDEVVEDYELPRWEHSLIDVTPLPVEERELTGMIRDWRHGRATKTLRQVLADGYFAVFAAAMIIAMLGGAVWQAQSAAAQCDSSACTVGRTLLPWVAMGATFCLTAMASRIFGPVVASAAEGFWLMDAPIRRGRLLWRRLVGVILAAGLIAAALGGLFAALTGYEWGDIASWMLAMGVGAAGLTALAAAEQTWGRTWLISLVQWLLGLAAVGVLFIIVSVAANWFGLSIPVIPSSSSVVWVAVVGGVLLLGGGVIALRRLGMIHRARLVSGGSLVAGMQGAAFAMDFGLMRDILVERDSNRRGHVRPQRGGGSGANALVWRELQRVWRYPKRILLVVVSVVVPYAVAALGFHTFSPFISSLILLVGFVPMLGSMRVMTRTKGLARTLPLSNPQIRKAMATVPALIALVWAIAATPAFWGISGPVHFESLPQAFITSVLTAVAGLLAAIRWVSAKPANYQMPMMQTGFGALPPGLMFNLVRGFDVVVVITGPMLLGWAWWVSALIAVIVGIALSGFYSMEEMQSMQEEMQKEKAKNGSGPGGLAGLLGSSTTPVTKQRIAPPRGYTGPRTGK
ncbi:MAG: DUF6297 family protein [Propionibacteriaceae bacterium]|jgi:hypothetical protein|nr:DUF6297 family protein [Propionibacteriaceae bacterium]